MIHAPLLLVVYAVLGNSLSADESEPDGLCMLQVAKSSVVQADQLTSVKNNHSRKSDTEVLASASDQILGNASMMHQNSTIDNVIETALNNISDLASIESLARDINFSALAAIDPALKARMEDQDTATNLEEVISKEIEFEIGSPKNKKKAEQFNKLGFVLVNMLLGYCGVDRCFVGQTLLGFVKGLTLGGIGIWFMIDYVIQIINTLCRYDELKFMGFDVHWEKDTITSAFVLCIVILSLKVAIAFCCMGFIRRKLVPQSQKPPEVYARAVPVNAPASAAVTQKW
jgi:hypothetical protein